MNSEEARRNINDLHRLAMKILDGISDDIKTSENKLKSEAESNLKETIKLKNSEIDSLKTAHKSELDELKKQNKEEIEKLEKTITAKNNTIKEVKKAVMKIIEEGN